MNDVIIKTENLCFVYESGEVGDKTADTTALSDVSLEIRRGEYIAILGHNGSGKSTLAKLLNLILIPSSGKIFIDGKDVSSPELSEDEVFEVRKGSVWCFKIPTTRWLLP